MITTETLTFDWQPTDKDGGVIPDTQPTRMTYAFSYDTVKFAAGFTVPEHSGMKLHPWSEETITLFRRVSVASSRLCGPLGPRWWGNMFHVLGGDSNESVMALTHQAKVAMYGEVLGVITSTKAEPSPPENTPPKRRQLGLV